MAPTMTHQLLLLIKLENKPKKKKKFWFEGYWKEFLYMSVQCIHGKLRTDILSIAKS